MLRDDYLLAFLSAIDANRDKMVKIHTRIKRRFSLSTNLSHYCFFHNRKRKKRPKTFKTEKAAHDWAAAHGIKQYQLKKVKGGKKFQLENYNGKDKNIADKENNS